jgi:hypothetical protein
MQANYAGLNKDSIQCIILIESARLKQCDGTQQ